MKHLHPPVEFTVQYRRAGMPTYPAGSPCCLIHCPIPARKPSGWPECLADDDARNAGRDEFLEFQRLSRRPLLELAGIYEPAG